MSRKKKSQKKKSQRKKSQRKKSQRKKSQRKKSNWRWSFIKDVVSNKKSTLWKSRSESGVHGTDKELAKKLLTSPVRDIQKFPKVVQWLQTHNVYISMTSSPKRLSKLQAVLATLDTTFLTAIYLVLPMKFGRSGKLYNKKLIKRIEKNFPKVRVLRIVHDFGPMTKLLPVAKLLTVRNELDSIVITIDDDICYPMGMINEVIYQKVVKYPKDVLHTSGGFNIRSQITEFRKLWPVSRATWPKMDIVEGFSGVAYNPWMLNTKLLEQLSNLRECFLSDDLVISYVLALHKITMRNIENKYWYMPYAYLYGELDDALHKGGSDAESNDYNIIKYRKCLIQISNYMKSLKLQTHK
jgi:hypothetical protein